MESTLKLVTASVIWGSIGLFVKNIDLPSMEIAFLRAFIASCFLLLAGFWLFSKDNLQSVKKNLSLILLSGIALGLNWAALFQSYKYTTIANATLVFYFAPVFVIIFTPIVLKEKLKFKDIISIITAMIGLFIIVSQQSNAADVASANLIGVAFGLISAILYASVLLINLYLKGTPVYETTTIQMLAASSVLLPFVIFRQQLHMVSFNNTCLLICIGVLHTGIAYFMYFSGMKEVNANNVAMLSYIEPLAAVLFGTIFLKEPLNFWQIVGGILILGSTFTNKKQQPPSSKNKLPRPLS